MNVLNNIALKELFFAEEMVLGSAVEVGELVEYRGTYTIKGMSKVFAFTLPREIHKDNETLTHKELRALLYDTFPERLI